MGKYKICPRCDLNYITDDEELCDVCKAELGLDSRIVLLDEMVDDDEPLKLCPVCKTAYISMDETMCESCMLHEQTSAEPNEDNEEWRNYLDDEDEDTGEEDIISLEELADDEEFKNDDFEDEDNPDTELDDYPDDFDDDLDLDDEDLDDLDDEDDEEDDEEDDDDSEE